MASRHGRMESPPNQSIETCGVQSDTRTVSVLNISASFTATAISQVHHTHSRIYHRRHVILANDSVVKLHTSKLNDGLDYFVTFIYLCNVLSTQME